MQHFHQNIHGWFDYEQLYIDTVKSLPNKAHVVEIGAYRGKSTAFLAVEIINSSKNITLDVIDTWNGEDGTDKPPWSDYGADPFKPDGDIFEDFKSNLSPVWDIINPIQLLSGVAVDSYKNLTLDFVFLDADHKYDGIKKDIVSWLPKIKNGGFIGGHDYNPSWGVIKAVNEIFTQNQIETKYDGAWLVKKV